MGVKKKSYIYCETTRVVRRHIAKESAMANITKDMTATVIPTLRYSDAAGAEVVIEIKDEDYGGRGCSCRDPEGNVWSFGSYDPWTSA